MQEDKTTEQADRLVMVHFMVPAKLRKEIKVIAAESDRKMPEVLAEALSQYAERYYKA